MASPSSALHLDSVSAAYGARSVLHELDIALAPGEIVAMLGHNGAGKTTALRVAAGLKRPSRGSVRLHDRDVGRRSASQRARAGVALVPEGVTGLFPSLSVRQNLAAVERPDVSEATGWAEVDARLREAFHEVLVDRLDQAAGSMSGGQRQMLAISLALLRRPSVLLLDEPSTGLAPVIVEKIFDVVAGLVPITGTSVLLVEQDVAHALRIATRIAVLRSGRLIAEFTRDGCPPPTELWKLF